jgi:hypothetical protein
MAKTETLLQRLLNAPDLTTIVPRLQPEVLHRVIQTVGLEDCAEFIALATPGQLGRIFDLDIWRAGTPGTDEQFDADRFGLWIAVLMEAGARIAAGKILGLDIELVIAGLVQHAAAFDRASVTPYTTLDGEEMPGRALNRGPVSEVGGYVLEAKRTSSAWDSILELLAFLDTEHPGYFHRLMREWVRLSDDPREEDGCDDLLDDDEQDLFDLSADREVRRERQGYVTPAQAHAFLKGGRELQLGGDRPAPSAIARAYFQTIESTLSTDPGAHHEPARAFIESGSPGPAADPSGVVEVLRDAGVLGAPPRALPGASDSQASRLSWIEAHVASHPASAEELAYLANAIVSGCSIQGRAFTTQEAGDGAVAVCNLGLENWPPHWSDPDLVTAFQVGWTILHRDVGLFVARGLIEVLAGIRCSDSDVQLRLGGLRRDLRQAVQAREPWRARGALDAILMLDPPSWAALLALLDECPAIHAALDASRQRRRTIDPADFAFISQNSQIAAIREFMAALPAALAS